jgi:translation initiation factor IF-1
VNDSRLANHDSRSVEGTVVAQLPSGLYTVAVEGPRQEKAVVTAHIGPGMGQNFIRLLVGDRVLLELMPRDGTRGRVTKRL